MSDEKVAYCSRCDKYVEPDLGFECPICESSLRLEEKVSTVLPEAVPEPAEETKSEEALEETPEEIVSIKTH